MLCGDGKCAKVCMLFSAKADPKKRKLEKKGPAGTSQQNHAARFASAETSTQGATHVDVVHTGWPFRARMRAQERTHAHTTPPWRTRCIFVATGPCFIWSERWCPSALGCCALHAGNLRRDGGQQILLLYPANLTVSVRSCRKLQLYHHPI